MHSGGSCGQLLADELLGILHTQKPPFRGWSASDLWHHEGASSHDGHRRMPTSFDGLGGMATQMVTNKVLGSGNGNVKEVPDTPPAPKGEGYYNQKMNQEMQKGHKSQYGSDNSITERLGGVSEDIKQSGTDEDTIMQTSFGRKVIRTGLPVFDNRSHEDVKMLEQMEMKNRYPGGDVMHQLMWEKWKGMGTMSATVPPEEDWYAGARLGEYARPLVMGPQRVGYLNQAPVPMSQSEDLLTLISEAGVGSRRSSNAAMYAKQSAGQAMEFFRLAQRRARQIFHDPPWHHLDADDLVVIAPVPSRLLTRVVEEDERKMV